MILLNSKNYFSLEYSLLPDNKIRRVTGSLKNNHRTRQTVVYQEDIQEMYDSTNSKALTLPLGFENTLNASNWYMMHGWYYINETTKYDAEYVRVEYLKIPITINVKSEQPITITSISVTPHGEGYLDRTQCDVAAKEGAGSPRYNQIVGTFPVSSVTDPFQLFVDSSTTFFDPDKVQDLISSTDGMVYKVDSIPFMKEYDLTVKEYCTDEEGNTDYNHYKYITKCIVSGLAYLKAQGIYDVTSNKTDKKEDTFVVDVLRTSDYSYQVTIDVVVKQNVVGASRYYESGKYYDIASVIMYNNVKSLGININAVTIDGSDIEYDYQIPVEDTKRYTTRIGCNEFVNDTTAFEGMRWDVTMAFKLMNKFKDGKLWTKAKVKQTFVDSNNLHINSRLQIKDVDNEYVMRNNTPCTFEVKNIEIVYESSQCYCSLIMMEV